MTQMPVGGWPIPRSAYLHVPFCRHRCGYCNFSVTAGRDNLAGDFLDAIEHELAMLGSPQPVDTLFIGGGTPTHLSLKQLNQLFASIDRWLLRTPATETTVEANPEDIDGEKLALLARHGVNRISLGVQSFNASKLKLLERTHSKSTASLAIQRCAEEIGNVSIDLIFAAPSESTADWRNDLETALSLPITHLSTYALTFEKGTSFWSQRLRGNLNEVCEDDQLIMYEDAIQMSQASGLSHYEISSFARDGFRCNHNLTYWHGRGWFGFGPGAAKFIDGAREVNHRSTTTYLRRMLHNGHSPVAEREPISPEQYACERAAFGIRMIDGIDMETIREECGVDVAHLRRAGIERCERQGLLSIRGTHYQLTHQGILMADSVATEFLG